MRLCRRLDEGEFDTRRAKGEGLPGGPPTVILSSCSLAALDDRDDRRSAGNGMGPGEGMAGGGGDRLERRRDGGSGGGGGGWSNYGAWRVVLLSPKQGSARSKYHGWRSGMHIVPKLEGACGQWVYMVTWVLVPANRASPAPGHVQVERACRQRSAPRADQSTSLVSTRPTIIPCIDPALWRGCLRSW